MRTRRHWRSGRSCLGKVIAVRVMAEQTGYRKTGTLSARTVPVAAGTMTLSEPPVVSGEARPGHTLTLEHGTTRPRDAQVAVQWLRDGVARRSGHPVDVQR